MAPGHVSGHPDTHPQSFELLYKKLPPHKQRELLGYIIRHVRVHPDKIEMALFGRATLERFTLNEGVFATRQNWLPESDALQNSKGLLFEFSFGQLNTAKGKKRLLTREAFAEAAHEKIARPNTRALADQILFARE